MQSHKIYIACLFLRIFLALFLKTFYHADEFYQGPEVAHYDVFGYGHLSWEWTNEKPLRSPVYHSIFSLLYFILQKIGMDTPFLIAYGPRIVQSFFSALLDLYIFKFLKLEGIINDNYIYLVMFTSWFPQYTFSRTLINNFEAMLFTIALYYWRLYKKRKDYRYNYLCRGLVIINFALRGTSLIPWIFIWPYDWVLQPVKKGSNFLREKLIILIQNIITLLLMVGFSITVDSLYYKKLTWCVWNFTQFNLIEGLSKMFGEHNFLQMLIMLYLLQSLWVVFQIIGIYFNLKKSLNQRQLPELLLTYIFFIMFIGLSPHKEVRFFQPLLPLMTYFTCLGLQEMDIKIQDIKKIALETQDPKQKEKIFKKSLLLKNLKLFLIFLAILVNSIHFGHHVIHNNASSLKVMEQLQLYPNVKGVHFYMISHSTPFYQFIHKNIPMYMLTLDPYLPWNETDNQKLFHHTEQFINSTINIYNQEPSHILIINHLYNRAHKFLTQKNYYIKEDYYQAAYYDGPLGRLNDAHILILEKM